MKLFNEQTISDQKRLVRGEHMLEARRWLRIRDGVHHKKWKVLILSGGSPRGEIQLIRELMPQSWILAVDREAVCLEAAIESGADDVLQCDLGEFEIIEQPYSRTIKPNAALAPFGQFDIVDFDLCANPSEIVKKMFRTYWQLVAPGGVMIATFSYGRDVIEIAKRVFERNKDDDEAQTLADAGVPELLIGRLLWLFGQAQLQKLTSILGYQGNRMPMCSCVFAKKMGVGDELKYLAIEPMDFEFAVAGFDPSLLYDCPKDRIEAIRRRFAAIKAHISRNRTTDDNSLNLVEAGK